MATSLLSFVAARACASDPAGAALHLTDGLTAAATWLMVRRFACVPVPRYERSAGPRDGRLVTPEAPGIRIAVAARAQRVGRANAAFHLTDGLAADAVKRAHVEAQGRLSR